MGHPTIDDFCAQVCEQVRFRPDHAAIRAELAAHWEDHAAALMERGIPEEEAARRALEAMGDPEEIGKELDKSHSPLLGWFQELSRAGVHAHFPAGSAFIPEHREYVLSSEIRM